MATAAEHYSEAVEALGCVDDPEQDPGGCHRSAQTHALLGLLSAAIEGTAPPGEERVREFAEFLSGIGGNCPADLMDYPAIAERWLR